MRWYIRDTTEQVTDGLMTYFGSRGTIAMEFATREAAEAHLSRYPKEYAARYEVISFKEQA